MVAVPGVPGVPGVAGVAHGGMCGVIASIARRVSGTDLGRPFLVLQKVTVPRTRSTSQGAWVDPTSTIQGSCCSRVKQRFRES